MGKGKSVLKHSERKQSERRERHAHQLKHRDADTPRPTGTKTEGKPNNSTGPSKKISCAGNSNSDIRRYFAVSQRDFSSALRNRNGLSSSIRLKGRGTQGCGKGPPAWGMPIQPHTSQCSFPTAPGLGAALWAT